MAKRLVFFITFAMPVLVCSCSPQRVPRTAIEAERIEPAVEDKTVLPPVESRVAASKPEALGMAQVRPSPSSAWGCHPPEPNNVAPDRAAWFHAGFADILREFVDDKGMVDYKSLRRKRLELRAVLNPFDNLDPNEYRPWPKEEKIAFWINAYNLQKLRVVTENYPIEPASRILTIYWGPGSIRHIEQEIARHKFLVMDEEFTFASVEKRFFRGEFDDPRVFFALSNACMSSPPLRNEPYYGRRLDEQLDDQVRRFLASPLAFRIDRDKRKVYLSALFQLSSYGKEFAEKFAIDRKFKDHPPATRAVLNFIGNYVSKQDVSFLEVGNYTIEYMTYDWTINDGS